MIEVDGLHKSYGETVAVDRVSFRARAGGVFGLLGPNGAGKSTSIGCISGLIVPTSGTVRVSGHDVVSDGRAAREGLGVVPQELALYEDLSARENASFWGAAYSLSGDRLRSRVDEVLAAVGLADRAEEPVKRFSGGMKRRLNFACGIVHRPSVLLLDEPTVGVDPQSRVRLLELVREQAADGTCVLYTTHYMEEAEELCDELAILDHGRLIAQGTLEELRRRSSERDTVRLVGRFPVEAVQARLAQVDDLRVDQVDDTAVRLSLASAPSHLAGLLTALSEVGSEVREVTLTQPSLESLFIRLTGKELRQ